MLDIVTQKSFHERFATIRTLNKKQLVSEAQKNTLTLQEAVSGSFFEYLGKTYFIRDICRYEETSDDFKDKKGYFIHEVTTLCIETGEIINFEWEYDDELEISVTIDRISFRNLKDDTGESIDKDDLDQIAEDKDVIVLNREKFWYDDDWASIYYRGSREEKVHMYEFENENQTRFLTIEEWSGSGKDEYQIYISSPVDSGSITIIGK